MSPASPKPTSHDVARLAGVSQTTVSYVMSGRRSVAPDTERRVREAMAALGYSPHSGARALRSQRSQVLGAVVPYRAGIDAASQHHFLVALAQQCRLHDYDLMVVTADEGVAGLRRVMDTALCDGLLITEVLTADPRAQVVADSGLPAVFIGLPGAEGAGAGQADTEGAAAAGTSTVEADGGGAVSQAGTVSATPATTSVGRTRGRPGTPGSADDPDAPSAGAAARVTATDADYEQAGQTAVRTLARHGHDRVALVVPASEDLGRLSFVQRFLTGARRGARQEAVTVDRHPVAPTFPAASRALEDLGEYDAFLLAPTCPADDWCNALARHGRPPGDCVSLLAASWDPDSPHCAWQPAHFDTHLDEVARTAVMLLVKVLTASPAPPPRTVIVPVTLREGDTLL